MITSDTALAIAKAYREIEIAEKLLAEITETIARREPPDIRDAFGRRVTGLELGVPSDGGGRRLFNVEWQLAKPIIESHIAAQRALISALCIKARNELEPQRVTM